MQRFDLSFENFDERLSKSKEALLIGFCSDCDEEEVGRVFDSLKLQCVKYTGVVNVKRERELTGAFEIRTTPTFLMISDGKLVRRTSGELGSEELEKFVSLSD